MNTNKIDLIKAEVKKLKFNLIYGACSSQIAMVTRCKEEAYDEVITLLDSLQKEPTGNPLGSTHAEFRTAVESLGISQEEHDRIVDELIYGKEPELVDVDDLPKKEPSIPDIVDEYFDEMPDPNIQYASREIGIKAHAEDYSFNIESELFQQLSKEQQKLWRKEIEQACISGGYYGLNIANDKRYDKEEPVSNDLEEEIKQYLNKEVIVTNEDVVISKHHEFHNFYVENLEEVAHHFANWQKQQIMKDAAEVTVHVGAGNYPYIQQIVLYDYDKDIPLAKEGDKYKIVLIKQG